MPSVWDKVKGGNCIQIAVIDSGLDIAHEDIGRGLDTYDNLWRNPGEDAWTDPTNPATGNGIDDNGNGLIDDWLGWDFDALNNDVRSPGVDHGTHVSGIVSAKLNNGRGASGIGGGANGSGLQLMFLGSGNNAPSTAAVDDAILYAVQNGADVIQMSLSVAPTAAIDNAIQTAINNAIPVVCASGNNGPVVSYPASNANVIAVGSTNQNDQRSAFSNFGPELFISAPGEQIRSTRIGNIYADDNGTSFAAPQISAVIGLIKSVNPNLTVQQIMNILSSTADKVGGVNYNWDANRPGHSRELGFGRLNANAALNTVLPILTGPGFVCTNATYSVNIPSPSFISWETSSNLTKPRGSLYPTVTVTKSGANGLGYVQVSRTLNGCVTSIRKPVQVGPEYRDFSISSYPTCARPGDIVYFVAEITGVNYNWAVGGGTILQGQGTQSIEVRMDDPSMNVQCYVAGTSEATCYGPEGGSATFVYECWQFNSVSTSPNPASSSIDVELSGEIGDKEPVEIELRNDYGALVRSETAHGKNFKINVADLRNGPYILKVKFKDQTLTHRVIIEK